MRGAPGSLPSWCRSDGVLVFKVAWLAPSAVTVCLEVTWWRVAWEGFFAQPARLAF